MSFSLSFTDLSITEKKSAAIIIANLSGQFNSGDFVTIMGPSGSGKTTLLSYLTCRLNSSPFHVSSKPLLNGKKYSSSQLSKVSAYVAQDDLLFGTITVRECFEFYGKLKLWEMTEKQRKQRQESVIKRLNLGECQDTLIGNAQFNKCISGGQKRRVAIGVQLLSNPSILIFDEPTSGLDSHNALIITKLLSSLSAENKLIIATIHQPSTLMYQQMQRLYLIKAGCLLYDGKANEIVPYMEQIGVKIDYRMNPMDFVMMEISEWKSKDGYRTKMTHLKWNQHKGQGSKKSQPQIDLPQDEQNVIEITQEAPLSKQFQPLFMRAFKNFYRLPSNQLNKIMNMVIIPFLLSTIYFDLGDVESIDSPQKLQTWIQDFTSFIFIASYFLFAMNVYDTVLVFPSEKLLVLKQTSSNLYSIQTYFWSRVIMEALGVILPAVSGSVSLYLICGLDLSGNHFAIFIGIYILMGFTGHFFGIFFGVFISDTNAINLLPMALIPFLTFGGLAVNLLSIPIWIRWMQYLSPIRHGYYMLLLDQLKTDKLKFLTAYDDSIYDLIGLQGTIEESLYWNIGLMVFFVVGSLTVLQIKRKIY